ncbi:MAG: GTPase ObgE [Erysipelotrichaceae bacterium]|nr:GTPase ObgE [Erysipelotrichaceae bacterium]
MQFIDKVKVHLKAGNGGDGIVAFRREKYVPLGGPAGGDGGNGGSIVFVADTNKSTLLDQRFHRSIKAENGERGKTKGMFGASAEDVIVKVPVGTIVKDLADERVLADLTADGQREVICQGGKGGRGNRHFATSRNTAPEHAELGTSGEERDVEIELKLLADVGLVGLPSVGKSTLLSVVSAARPEIADYPFTTLTPQLGMVKVDNTFSFVMADLPGLIEGAAEGKGLGHDFLKHIERCRLLVHVLDMGHEDPIQDYEVINRELADYPGKLSERIQLILCNKMDEEGAEEKLQAFREKYPDREVFPASTLINEGTEALLWRIKQLLPEIPLYPLYDTELSVEKKVFRYDPEEEKEFAIFREGEHLWRLESEKLLRRMDRLDLHQEEDALRFARLLRNMGIEEALRQEGCQNGDEVYIGDFAFDFVEED